MSGKTNENALENIKRKSKDLLTRAANTFKRMDKPAKLLVLVLFIAVGAEIPLFLGIGGAFNQPPVLNGATPTASLTMDEGQSVVFAVSTNDPEGGDLYYQWTLNGVPVGEDGASFTFKPDYTMGGIVYTLNLAVSDGKNLVNQAWTVTVTNTLKKLVDFEYGDIEELYSVGDKVFFFDEYDDGESYEQLWCSDGSVEGTRIVKNLLDNGPSSSTDVATSDDAIYFVYWDSAHGSEIWKSDGTFAGTVPMTNFTSPNVYLYNLYAWDGCVYFSGDNLNGTNGLELWKTDGTPAGTVLVKDIRAGSLDSQPADFIASSSRLFFFANNGSVYGLWCTDGTTAGTKFVTSLNIADKDNMCALGSSLYVFGDDTTTGQELWRIDGTGTTVTLVKEIMPLTADGSPAYMEVVGNTIYFSANDGSGDEPWKSDGTAAGTVMVKDINTVSDDSSPEDFSAFGNIVLFQADDGVYGSELWRTDGTAAGTFLVKDIYPVGNNSYPDIDLEYSYGISVGRAIFPADDGIHGAELWSTDGTVAGTHIVTDICVGSGDSDPDCFQTIGNAAFFFANDGTSDGLYVY